MHIQFSLNAPPKARFATITTMCSFLTLPKSQNLYTVDEQVLRDLLNGKPTHVRVRTSPEDCAVKGLFNTPGALTLSLGGRYLRLRTKLLDSETCCHGP